MYGNQVPESMDVDDESQQLFHASIDTFQSDEQADILHDHISANMLVKNKHRHAQKRYQQHKLTAGQLAKRTSYLKSRVEEVDRCKIQVLRLADNFKHYKAKHLQVADVSYKRHQLTPKVCF